jgi:hypothetical protein
MHHRIFAILVFGIFVINTSYTQENPSFNQFFLGGSFGFSTQKNTPSLFGNSNENSQTSLSVNPYFGKILTEQWMAGIQLFYGFSRIESENTLLVPPRIVQSETNENEFGLGIFARYIVNPNQSLKLMLQPDLSFNLRNSERLNNSRVVSETEIWNFRIRIQPGLLYQFNKKWRGLVFLGNMTYSFGELRDGQNDNQMEYSSFQTNFNLAALRIGVEYLL